ncbi:MULTISPECIES: hypothetical protein [unclassified Rhizobium]|uniref:hypothetical protein n=1 Tax=unclassified Rhizobium TaxID=2613769 RepID=UPI0016038714|nr:MULTISPECIES: hypothetical protein [unclassified Rhizobium]MBB1249773.1 hypothetical protein [Rhizobium sp. G21]MCV3767574.1 hypothetical protein [Rhizobium sp. TRM95796]
MTIFPMTTHVRAPLTTGARNPLPARPGLDGSEPRQASGRFPATIYRQPASAARL